MAATDMDESINGEGTEESFVKEVLTIKHVCTVCDYSTLKKYNLNQHMRVHTDTANITNSQKGFLCGHCGKGYQSKPGLDTQVKGTHENSYKYECDRCPKKYNNKANYRGHLASHDCALHEQCTRCKKTFVFHESRLLHQIRCGKSRETLRPIECRLCEKKFSSKDGLVQHTKGEHGNATRYRCKRCMRSFKWRLSLAYHAKRCQGPF